VFSCNVSLQIGFVNDPSSDTESSDDETIPDDMLTFHDLATVSDGQTPPQQFAVITDIFCGLVL